MNEKVVLFGLVVIFTALVIPAALPLLAAVGVCWMMCG